MLIRPTLELVDPTCNQAHGVCYRAKTLERETDKQVHTWHAAERVKSGQFITLLCGALEVFTTPDVRKKKRRKKEKRTLVDILVPWKQLN